MQDNYIVVIFTSLFGQYNVQKICEPTIIPVATNEDYSIDNGLLLEKNIHCTFDKYLWAINPDTFRIESRNIGTIKKYQNVQLQLFDDMRDNLRQHYNIYKSRT